MDAEVVICAREGEGSYQDEEALVGGLLVVRDSGEHRQHQAAEHQQETETHIITHKSVNTSSNTHVRNKNTLGFH